jgi:hypothetical protein
MQRLTALVVVLAVLLTAGVSAYGQEESAPQEQPVPQAQPAPQEQPTPPAESVLLRLKFKSGETMRYRIYAEMDGVARMDMPMPGGAPEMPGQMPLHAVAQGEGVAKVLGVDATGAARLRVRAENLSFKMDLMGHKLEMSVKGGSYTVKVDGEKAEGGKIPMMPGNMKIPFIQEPLEIKIGPRGEVLDLVIPGMGDLSSLMPGMSMKEMMKSQLLLPAEPLTVGQTWSESKSETLPGMNTPVTTDIKMALTSVETWDGDRKIANIRVESVTAMKDFDLGAAMQAAGTAAQGAPPMSGTMSMDQQLAGNMQFDATQGILVRFDFQANQQMSMHSTVTVPQQGAQSMGMDMQFTLKGAVAKTG